MRFYFTYILLICFSAIHAQLDTLPSYFVENNQVVLEFDIRKFQNEDASDFSKVFEFADINIATILNKNHQWPQDGWMLQKTKKYIYQLRKDLASFDKSFPWESKYNINGSDWAQPVSEVNQAIDSNFRNELDALNTKVYKVVKNGNTTFHLTGYRMAKKVILAGSFNNWNEQEIKMNPTNDGWTIDLELQHGIYEYKFIADDQWLHDPANKLIVKNEHKTWNSILLVGKTVTFQLPGYLDAKEVILGGSFNNWNEKALKLKKDADGWFIELPLPPGKHYYKFIVDGKWIPDPENIFQEPDRQNNWNSVLIIH